MLEIIFTILSFVRCSLGSVCYYAYEAELRRSTSLQHVNVLQQVMMSFWCPTRRFGSLCCVNPGTGSHVHWLIDRSLCFNSSIKLTTLFTPFPATRLGIHIGPADLIATSVTITQNWYINNSASSWTKTVRWYMYGRLHILVFYTHYVHSPLYHVIASSLTVCMWSASKRNLEQIYDHAHYHAHLFYLYLHHTHTQDVIVSTAPASAALEELKYMSVSWYHKWSIYSNDRT